MLPKPVYIIPQKTLGFNQSPPAFLYLILNIVSLSLSSALLSKQTEIVLWLPPLTSRRSVYISKIRQGFEPQSVLVALKAGGLYRHMPMHIIEIRRPKRKRSVVFWLSLKRCLVCGPFSYLERS